jgi:hypothetical protein
MISRGIWFHLAVGAVLAAIVALARTVEGGPDPFPDYAARIVGGEIPYRDYPLEYPPLALFPLVMPRILGGADGYAAAFFTLAAAFALLTGFALLRLARLGWSRLGGGTPREALLMYTALALAGIVLVVWRFDLYAAMFAAFATLALAMRHSGWAGAALGLGTMAKIFPAFLMPVFFAYYAFRRDRVGLTYLVGGFAFSVAASLAEIILVAGPRQAFSWLSYQNRRGVEIESVHGGLALLGDVLGGPTANIGFGFGSYEVTSPLLQPLELPLLMLGVALVVGVVVGGLASFREDMRVHRTVRPQTLITYVVATLLLIIVTNKVLSPQYMMWILPFVPLLPFRYASLFMVAMVLTTIEYPLGFTGLRRLDPTMVWVLNVRNVLLIALLVWLIEPGLELLRPRRSQRVAMLEKPPSKPAETPNISSPIASRRRLGAMTVISNPAKATVAILATVRPGRPTSLARRTTTGFASAPIPWRSIITRNDA